MNKKIINNLCSKFSKNRYVRILAVLVIIISFMTILGISTYMTINKNTKYIDKSINVEDDEKKSISNNENKETEKIEDEKIATNGDVDSCEEKVNCAASITPAVDLKQKLSNERKNNNTMISKEVNEQKIDVLKDIVINEVGEIEKLAENEKKQIKENAVLYINYFLNKDSDKIKEITTENHYKQILNEINKIDKNSVKLVRINSILAVYINQNSANLSVRYIESSIDCELQKNLEFIRQGDKFLINNCFDDI